MNTKKIFALGILFLLGFPVVSLATYDPEWKSLENIFESNGKIGIGIAIPNEALDINGNITATGTLKLGTITLPNTDGTNGQILKTDGSGNLTWQDESGGNAAGITGEIQFNDNGNFWTDGSLFWDNVNKRLGVGTATPSAPLEVNGNIVASTPTASNHVATKEYVDAQVVSASSGGGMPSMISPVSPSLINSISGASTYCQTLESAPFVLFEGGSDTSIYTDWRIPTVSEISHFASHVNGSLLWSLSNTETPEILLYFYGDNKIFAKERDFVFIKASAPLAYPVGIEVYGTSSSGYGANWYSTSYDEHLTQIDDGYGQHTTLYHMKVAKGFVACVR